MSKYYNKNIRYTSTIEAAPLNRNMPSKFRVIHTAGEGYCGYYALNIGLGMCGKKTNRNATDIMNDFKKYVNNLGNKNKLVIMSRRSNQKNWTVTNDDLHENAFRGMIDNEGRGFFNRHRARGINCYPIWLEESFWMWACNQYKVEINILFVSPDANKGGRTWTCYKPISNNRGKDLCKIYIHSFNEFHYSAMEPVKNTINIVDEGAGVWGTNINSNNELARALSLSLNNKKGKKPLNLGQSSDIRRILNESIETQRLNNQVRSNTNKATIESIKTEIKRHLNKLIVKRKSLNKKEITEIDRLLSEAKNNSIINNTNKVKLLVVLKNSVESGKIKSNDIKRFVNIIKFLSKDKKWIKGFKNEEISRLLNLKYLKILNSFKILNKDLLERFLQIALNKGNQENINLILKLQNNN